MGRVREQKRQNANSPLAMLKRADMVGWDEDMALGEAELDDEDRESGME